MPQAFDARHVLKNATLRYHAGEITFDEWSACVREFRTSTKRPQRSNGDRR